MKSISRARDLLKISAIGERRSFLADIRRILVMSARNSKNIAITLEGMSGVERFHDATTSKWTQSMDIVQQGGTFNALSLPHWIEFCRKAGVTYIPAEKILALNEEEIEALSSKFDIQELLKIAAPITKSRIENEIFPMFDDVENNHAEQPSIGVDLNALVERIASALDDLPANSMIRTASTGPSNLKTLAGVGLIDDHAPEVAVAENVWAGPGWVRIGNRRYLEVNDTRLMQAHLEGRHSDPFEFYARPWVKPSRLLKAIDPHTFGTPFEAEGQWPAEWRAFVYDGKVTGVSSYYAWAGKAGAEDARIALQVRQKAQMIVNEVKRSGALPQFMSVEHIRKRHPEQVHGWLPEDEICATIDFIEAFGPDGKPDVLFLEAGPAYHPCLPGGHPCAFAGVARPDGVAFKIMDGIDIGNPATWLNSGSENRNSDKIGVIRDGAILSWVDVENLAMANDEPTDTTWSPSF